MEQEIIGQLESFRIQPKDNMGKPSSIVIFIHGYGADGRDLISLGMEWANGLPNTLFISPNAPQMCEANPFGRQWFSLDPFSREAKRERIQKEWKILSRYINAVSKRFDVEQDRIVLCGFSQGTMMSLHTALSRDTAIAGILGYSGSLLWPELLETTSHKAPPIHLIHGEEDDILPITEWEHAMEHLTKHDFPITGYKQSGLAHGIDATGIQSGLSFIKKTLND